MMKKIILSLLLGVSITVQAQESSATDGLRYALNN